MRIPPALNSACAAVLGCLLLAPAALAANGEDAALNLDEAGGAAAAQGAGPGGGGLVRTIVGLAVVLGVIYGLHWVLKQVKASREETASGQGLRSLATLPLGPNRSLHLVRAGGEVVLVGVGEAGVTPIRTYGEHEARALGLVGPDDVPPASGATLAAPGLLPGQAAAPARTSLGRAVADLRRRTVIR
jgi:flagellar protein FliO/FliZ